jgi:hypothetical protein
VNARFEHKAAPGWHARSRRRAASGLSPDAPRRQLMNTHAPRVGLALDLGIKIRAPPLAEANLYIMGGRYSLCRFKNRGKA